MRGKYTRIPIDHVMKAISGRRLLEDDDDDGETAVDNKTTENTVAALLQPDNVMSILVSASFLKMTALVDEALKFAHDNMNKILAVTQNLNCLGEPLLSR